MNLEKQAPVGAWEARDMWTDFKPGDDRYRHSVIEIATDLLAYGKGSLDSYEDFEYRARWLEWRLGPEGWVPSRDGDVDTADIDSAVLRFATAALRYYRLKTG